MNQNPFTPFAPPPEAVPPLRDAEIHLWPLRIDAYPAAMDGLSEAEIARAERYRHPGARAAFVQTRGRLRWLLGQYLGQAPERIRFTANPHGKPRLAGTEENRGLVFNVSHSGALALLGFARDLSLGLDVEHISPRRGLEGVADYCLSDGERDGWRMLNPTQRLAGFLRYWTAKEAFCKATGRGIALGLRAIEVASDGQRFDGVPEEFGPAAAWALHGWDLGEYRCAVACRNPSAAIIHCPAEFAATQKPRRFFPCPLD